MKLGIIGAMAEEVAQLKEIMRQPEVTQIAGMDFYKGLIHNKEAVVVRSGVGKVNAAVCTQILVDHFAVEAIVNTGIAGSLSNAINIGDIVLATDLVQHDVEATTFGYQVGQIPQMKTFAFEADEDLRKKVLEYCGQVLPEVRVHCGRIVSGDQFISDKKKKQWLAETFQGCCTEMEGAAIAQAAYLNQIPRLMIRSISDKADDSAQMDYKEFEKLAIRNSVVLTRTLIERL